MQKALGFDVAACHTYFRVSESRSATEKGQENLILATFSNRILVYRDAQLVWTARYNLTPASIRVGSFGGIDGFIVSLTDSGKIAINFLGKYNNSRSDFLI